MSCEYTWVEASTLKCGDTIKHFIYDRYRYEEFEGTIAGMWPTEYKAFFRTKKGLNILINNRPLLNGGKGKLEEFWIDPKDFIWKKN